MDLCRRPLLPTRIYAFAAAVLVSIAINGCGNTSATSSSGTTPASGTPSTSTPAAAGDVISVGFIYSDRKTTTATTRPTPTGPRPFAKWTASRSWKRRAVPETADVQKSIESMIQLDDAKRSSRRRSGISIRTCSHGQKVPRRDVPALRWTLERKSPSEERGKLLRLHR